MREDILLPGLKTLKKLEAEKTITVAKLITTEEDAIKFLHPSLLAFCTNLCMEYHVPFVLKSKSYIATIMGLAMGYFVKVWGNADAKICFKMLVTCERIAFFC
jgi:hypothetical protein